MRGFSLIELLVVVAIVGVLAVLALPGYSQLVSRALRQDARLALLRVHHRQENYFAQHLSFARQLTGSSGLDLAEQSERGHYRLEILAAADGMSYLAVARATTAGRQAGDQNCTLLAIDQTGRRRSADATGNWRDDDPWRCWG